MYHQKVKRKCMEMGRRVYRKSKREKKVSMKNNKQMDWFSFSLCVLNFDSIRYTSVKNVLLLRDEIILWDKKAKWWSCSWISKNYNFLYVRTKVHNNFFSFSLDFSSHTHHINILWWSSIYRSSPWHILDLKMNLNFHCYVSIAR